MGTRTKISSCQHLTIGKIRSSHHSDCAGKRAGLYHTSASAVIVSLYLSVSGVDLSGQWTMVCVIRAGTVQLDQLDQPAACSVCTYQGVGDGLTELEPMAKQSPSSVDASSPATCARQCCYTRLSKPPDCSEKPCRIDIDPGAQGGLSSPSPLDQMNPQLT
ncbi:hypothetical protein PoB_005180400 [Plakobranchus ocellatus]|uniref:Uncharacterized protein n=1 Tax=Plakobranchus ocellatus TaxID=259542 RepID=A0AAV4C2F8_9GAST|nr:hypothetical protein PoB_005180400 [Plakobranchus ocellatus]